MEKAPITKKRLRLTKAAGWLAIVFGVVHIVVAPLEHLDTWSRVMTEGWWNTFTLDKATTFAQLDRSETFWVTLGSFGVPVLVLGCHVVWSAHQHQRVPGWLGWIVVTWALFLVTTAPASPAWALAVIGWFLVLGDRGRVAKESAAHPASVKVSPDGMSE